MKTWLGHFPTKGSVTIPKGQTVLLDTTLNLQNLTINGKVVCAKKDLAVQSGWIMVNGSLECGSQSAPYLNKLTVTLTGNNKKENVLEMGSKFLGVPSGGSLELHGATRTSWTRLAASASKATTHISVQGSPKWKAGDSIVVASSDFHFEHAEMATIAAINGNVITLSQPLAYNHWCQRESFGAKASISECAEVGLLTHNILIQGDAGSTVSGFGGHIMVMGGNAKISGVELYRMGQKGMTARYPMHWHLTGPVPGQYITDSSIHHAYNRFMSLHDTSELQVLRNVGYETIGHGFYLEDGSEENNTLVENLGLSVHNGNLTPSDNSASVYWISNPKNILRNNVSAGSESVGFWLGFPEHPIGLSATNSIWPRRTPLLEFSGNVSHSNKQQGLYVDGGEKPDRTVNTTWYEPHLNPADPNSPKVSPEFKTFTAYKNRREGIWIRSFAGPLFTGAKLADNWISIYYANIGAGNGAVQDSLIVGETANLGNPDKHERTGINQRELPRMYDTSVAIHGIAFYDGYMAVKNTLFANFVPNTQREAGALSSWAPNPYWISTSHFTEKLSFVNANRVYLHDITPDYSGDAFATFVDKDGSVSGTAGTVIVPKNPLLFTGKCKFNAAWNAYACPHDYVNIRIFDRAGGSSPSGTLVTRDDGVKFPLISAKGYPGQVNANLIAERTYSLTFPKTISKRIGFITSEKTELPIRLSMAYPYSNFTVKLYNKSITRATNLAELNSGGYKYFHDGQRLHLRLINKDSFSYEIKVERP